MNDDEIAGLLAPIPLEVNAERRIRTRVLDDVAARRLAMLDAGLHGGFAMAAVAWAILMGVGGGG